MERDGLGFAHLVALAGALLLGGALWLPWYEVHLGALRSSGFTEGLAQVPAPVAAFAQGLVAQLDGLRVDAWQAFDGADVGLAIGAVVAVLVLLAAAGAVGAGVQIAPSTAGRAVGLIGAGLGLLVAVQLLHRPGPSGMLELAPGAWVALGGCALMAVGGALAAAAAPHRAGPA